MTRRSAVRVLSYIEAAVGKALCVWHFVALAQSQDPGGASVKIYEQKDWFEG